HNFSVSPVITSRHPLWDQDDLHSGADEGVAKNLAAWPLRWRAVLITTTTDARPEEVVRVAGPSIWPFVAACGTLAIFAAELMKLRWAAVIGATIVVAAVIAWNWPDRPPMTETEELEFERSHDLPVRAGGSRAMARWGTGLVILFASIAFVSILLGYFYLRLENDTWPPAGHPVPSLLRPALSTLVFLTGFGFVVGGARAIARDD